MPTDGESRTFHGIGVSAGTAVGPLVVVTPAPKPAADEAPTTDAAAASAVVRTQIVMRLTEMGLL